MLLDERGIARPAASDDTGWSSISKQFAQGAKGEVRVILGENVRPNAIWHEEFDELQKNPFVTKIVRIDPSTLEEIVLFVRN